MSSEDKIILREMEYALKELQRVSTLYYDAAYFAAYGGVHSVATSNPKYHDLIIRGRSLGLNAILKNWR